MNISKLIIKQGAGIGDVLFALRIGRLLYEKYQCKIVWPIIDEISWIADYIDAPYIEWPSYNEYHDLLENPSIPPYPFHLDSETVIVPVANAWPGDGLSHHPIMKAKYIMLGLDFNGWQDDIKIKRNKNKEKELYYNVLNLTDDSDYTFITRQYSTPRAGQPDMKSPFMPDTLFENHNKIVESSVIPGYNIFDWLMVIEKAKDIHLVSTCLVYILEAIDTKLPTINIYNRDDDGNLRQLDFMKPTFKQNWNFIEAR